LSIGLGLSFVASGNDYRLTVSVSLRQQIISAFIDPASARIVEIGALDNPTFSPSDYNIRFIDYATKEQFRGMPWIGLSKSNIRFRRWIMQRKSMSVLTWRSRTM
jgi:hypothetical protein